MVLLLYFQIDDLKFEFQVGRVDKNFFNDLYSIVD